jgi:hypothetical protein
MNITFMASRAMSALGVTIVIGYGIYEFVKKQRQQTSVKLLK